MKLCECGCGEEVKKRFILGHYWVGKNRSEETKNKISKKISGRELSDKWKIKISDSNKGRKVPDEVRKNMSKAQKKYHRENPEVMSGKNNPSYGKKRSDETRKRMSEAKIKYFKNPENRKKTSKTKESKEFRKKDIEKRRGIVLTVNGVKKNDIFINEVGYTPAIYKTYVKRLTIDEDSVKGKFGFLMVKCAYCGRYYYPSAISVSGRITALSGKHNGEYRLYCSDNCKKVCPVFRKVLYQSDRQLATSREVQPQLRQLVLKRDNYKCQKCERSIEEVQLHCHHFEGVVQNPIESADVDMCITLCKECHKEAHGELGCRYVDLQCKEE